MSWKCYKIFCYEVIITFMYSSLCNDEFIVYTICLYYAIWFLLNVSKLKKKICQYLYCIFIHFRTLQLTPEAWLRLGIDHASITSLSIYPNGRASLRSFSNSGFMPPDAISS